MISGDCLENFIHLLAVNENIMAVCQNAFAQIGAEYSIGKLTSFFQVEGTLYTAGGSSQEDILFIQDGDIKERPDYIREFVTGEKGHVRFALYRMEGQPGFTQEEKLQPGRRGGTGTLEASGHDDKSRGFYSGI